VERQRRIGLAAERYTSYLRQLYAAEGLVPFLAADDNFEQFRDHDFNDLILRCRNLDPQINPRIPLFNMPDFTLPDDVRKTCGKDEDDYDRHKHDHDPHDQGRANGE
jgi:hypothetical protein